MTETKWTKGPWRIDRDFPYDIRDDHGQWVADTCPTKVVSQRKANAHLIAAGPDLAEALDTAPERPDMEADKYEIEGWFQDYRDWLVTVDAALAKAKGES